MDGTVAAAGEKDSPKSQNKMKSSKFFKRLMDVVKDKKDKEDSKKRAKTEEDSDMIPYPYTIIFQLGNLNFDQNY